MTSLPDPWHPLRALTAARIALGRSGSSLPTSAHLDFQLAHARARDAVHHPADLDVVAAALDAVSLDHVRLTSRCIDAAAYLKRPVLGRRLDDASRAAVPGVRREGEWDLSIVVADGLSGFAVERHAAALATALARRLGSEGWRIAPIAVVRHGRVAVGDEIGELFGASLVVVLLGERPGLSAPDSLGAYLTWAPRVGRTDAERNCVSNIRPEGLPIPAAADKLCWLLREARRRRGSGVALKDEAPAGPIVGPGHPMPGGTGPEQQPVADQARHC
ncbi:MAG TPA: ethanolamine ammonia-lyase subunit EutC [Gemmatimonadales bacterium]|nr:ethanolamine ammonia-lyase subunit EutC [Gemmatimonadales bacterium]